MHLKKILYILILALVPGLIWAGDTAVYADLGFSPDGRTYMFAQHGVLSDTLKPWAELYVVDVARNNFVSGGRLSYTHDRAVTAGQDGSAALYQLLAANTSIAEQYRINYLSLGHPLFLSVDGPLSPVQTIEFRDFDAVTSYRSVLRYSIEGSGSNLTSSFYIDLEQTSRYGTRKSYTIGTPQVKRPGVTSYRIRRVIMSPLKDSMIFVIEMRVQNGSDTNIRYMVETLIL